MEKNFGSGLKTQFGVKEVFDIVSKIIFAAIFFAIVFLALSGRYALVSTSDVTILYRIDRLTGAVEVCRVGQGCRSIKGLP